MWKLCILALYLAMLSDGNATSLGRVLRPEGKLLKDVGFTEASLLAHNEARKVYSAEPLSWDQELAEIAGQWASQCHFEHSGGILLQRPYGENLIASSPAQQNMSSAVSAWVGEVSLYNFARPGFSEETGHFTQVVWRDTKMVGCAQTICPPGSIFPQMYGASIYTVCEYDPPGNIVGSEERENFERNVLPNASSAAAISMY